MDDEREHEEFNEKLQHAIYDALQNSPAMQSLVHEMNEKGFQVKIGVLIGLILSKSDSSDDEDSSDESVPLRFNDTDLEFFNKLNIKWE